MHLKLDTSGVIDDGDIARDLGQDFADIVVLSAADSDLAAFGSAYAKLPAGFPTVRLTNLLALGHPASVDLYVERTLRDAKIVVLRMLGGESYWPHGVESLRTDALRRGAVFACIPGETSWNAALAARGTLDAHSTHALWRYCLRRRRGQRATGAALCRASDRPRRSAAAGAADAGGRLLAAPAGSRPAPPRHRDLLSRAGGRRRYRADRRTL